jgi:hypothetical protein
VVRFLVIFMLLIPVVASGSAGCTWQPNSGSEAVSYTPGEGLGPANGPGYMNGEPMDARRR